MIGVVAHDAGGAEIISSHIRRHGLNCLYCLEGAARGVFARKLDHVESVPLDELVGRSETLLCGTSFLSDLEWRALGLARLAGKHTVAVLDHWVNYRQRFLRHGAWHFPDEIWVGDEIGERIARRELPDIPTTFVPNPYFLDLKRELAATPRAEPSGDGVRILYVSEPVREDGLALHGDERYWGYTEEDALCYFLSNVHVFGQRISQIVIRPHPQEQRGKYDWVVDQFDLPIVTGQNKTLLEQIVACDVLVGCATMAMVVGLLAGKRVVSCIPPGGTADLLPHPEIEKMHVILSLDSKVSTVGSRRRGHRC